MAKKKPVEKSSETKVPSFEESVERLEHIASRLESGELTLDQSLGAYEEGVKLLRHAHELLKKTRQRVEVLSQIDEDGQPITEPLEHQANTALGRRSGGSEPADNEK